MARLKELYQKEFMPKLKKEFNYKSGMQVPRLQKILVNMGLGEAIQNIKVLDSATDEIMVITGQKPVSTKARKSIANFKLRKGMPIGAMVTLRANRGIKEQIIFPEIDYDKIDKIKGLNINIVTTAKTDEEGKALLRLLGMPFRD